MKEDNRSNKQYLYKPKDFLPQLGTVFTCRKPLRPITIHPYSR